MLKFLKKNRISRLRSILSISLILILYFFVNVSNAVATKPTLKDAQGLAKKTAQSAGVAGTTSIASVVARVLVAGFTLVGLIFFTLIFYGGFTWMTAQGSEEKISKSRNMIVAAAIGLIIVISAYAITTFVTTGIAGENTTNYEHEAGDGSACCAICRQGLECTLSWYPAAMISSCETQTICSTAGFTCRLATELSQADCN